MNNEMKTMSTILQLHRSIQITENLQQRPDLMTQLNYVDSVKQISL